MGKNKDKVVLFVMKIAGIIVYLVAQKVVGKGMEVMAVGQNQYNQARNVFILKKDIFVLLFMLDQSLDFAQH